ncbi:MAG: hypothetical protein R2742_16475 [Micropruina glycogenica]|nr:hypothetical protein [Micropruina sp.]
MSFRRPLTLLLAVPALLVGCSAAPAAPSTTPPPAISVNPPTSVPTGANTTTSAAPAAACPSGEYRATGFTAVGANAASGKGKVTDVGVTFRDGRYTFDFDDDQTVSLTLGDSTAKVRIDGEVRGTYTGTPEALTFTLGDTKGTARITQNGKSQTITMKQVAAVLAPQGKGSAACSGQRVTLKSGALTWDLVRDDD